MDDKTPIIAIDPGTHKCGVAFMADAETILWKEIINRWEIAERTAFVLLDNPESPVIMGDRTQGRELASELRDKSNLEVIFIDEGNSTELARDLYWKENKPGCIWSIFPASFRPLSQPIDDYAAVIIGKRYFEQKEQ